MWLSWLFSVRSKSLLVFCESLDFIPRLYLAMLANSPHSYYKTIAKMIMNISLIRFRRVIKIPSKIVVIFMLQGYHHLLNDYSYIIILLWLHFKEIDISNCDFSFRKKDNAQISRQRMVIFLTSLTGSDLLDHFRSVTSKKLPYMEMDCQFITIYGKFVTTQTAYFSRADNSLYWKL